MEELRKAVQASTSTTYVAQQFRKAFGVIQLPARKKQSRPRRERIDVKRLIANKWGAAERHGKGQL